MKYAVVSDIHGNYPALQAVMEDVKKQGISGFIFAGDYCISGPWPDKCISAIRAITDKYIIRGNEEKYLEYNGIKIHITHSSVDFLGDYPFYTWNSVTVAERNRESDRTPEQILADMADEREKDPSFSEAVAGHFFLAFTEQYAKEAGDERRPYALDTWESAFRNWDLHRY